MTSGFHRHQRPGRKRLHDLHSLCVAESAGTSKYKPKGNSGHPCRLPEEIPGTFNGIFRNVQEMSLTLWIFHDVVASCFLVMMTGTFERALLFQLHQPKPGGWASPVLSALVIILWSSALEEGIHLSCHVQLLPDISAPRTRRCKKKDSAHHCRFLVWVGRVRN